MERREPRAGVPGLAEYADGFVAWLGGLGYSPRTCEAQVALLRHLAGWLAQQGVPLAGLSSEVACEYAAVRRDRAQLRSERALRPVLSFLRELGAVPPATVVVSHEPVDVLLARFRGWLSRERGLAPATVSSYLHQARPFADACAGQIGVLTAARVSDLATVGASGLRARSAQVRANAVRALLRFAWLEGLTAVPLAGFVGSFAAPAGRRAERPQPRAGGGVPRVRAGGPGRAAERADDGAAAAAGPAGRGSSRAVAGRHRLAPGGHHRPRQGKPSRPGSLPADVGGLLAGYLRDGRPAGTAHRQVFLALDAPHAPVTHAAVTSVAGRALRDAGIRGDGAAHLLRHTAACGVLAAGGGLAEAGQLLRHDGPQVTAVARSLTALRSVARPWPDEGGPR